MMSSSAINIRTMIFSASLHCFEVLQHCSNIFALKQLKTESFLVKSPFTTHISNDDCYCLSANRFFVLFRGSKCVESEGWVCQHDKNAMISLNGEIKNECNIIRKSCIEVNLAPPP